MRKVILSILLAGVAVTPAVAQDHGRWRQNQEQSDAQPDGRQAAREARQEQHQQAREERSSDAGNAGRWRQPEQQPQQQPQPQVEQRREQWQGGNFGARQQDEGQQQWQRRGGFEGRRFDHNTNVQADVQAPPQVDQQRQFDGSDGSRWTRDRSNWTGERDSQSGTWNRDAQSGTWRRGDLRQGDRPTPNVMRDPNPLIVSNTPREGTQPPLRADSRRYSRNWSGTWNGTWRNDHRYDWRRWRDRHQSIFRIGIYYDPFGWRYRPYQIGWRLWPSYYSRNYWIDDPWQYRLPYAPPGTVWVRYWDDALLVDVYTGEVIDVIRNFFW